MPVDECTVFKTMVKEVVGGKGEKDLQQAMGRALFPAELTLYLYRVRFWVKYQRTVCIDVWARNPAEAIVFAVQKIAQDFGSSLPSVESLSIIRMEVLGLPTEPLQPPPARLSEERQP